MPKRKSSALSSSSQPGGEKKKHEGKAMKQSAAAATSKKHPVEERHADILKPALSAIAERKQKRARPTALPLQNDSALQHEGRKRRATPSEPPAVSPFSAPSSRPAALPSAHEKALSKMQLVMKRKLEGGQFRAINEHLYSSDSNAAFGKFQREPHLFDVYHRGFREQVEKWPVHPLDAIIAWVQKRPKAVVADFGCGEARLAASVRNAVHSFDLVAANERITACDMAHVPLSDGSVDVAVFCLALMNTNIVDFVREARRVLKPGGILKVAEVRSRFEGTENGESSSASGGKKGGGSNASKAGVEDFKRFMVDAGFDCTRLDSRNTMFFAMDFVRSEREPREGAAFLPKACMYKKR